MLIITISIFVCVTLGVMGLYWLMFRPTSAATERLKSLGGAEGVGAGVATVTAEASAAGALAVTIMNPDYMSVLWKDPRGHNLLYAALFMQTMGMLIIRKILKIKI